MEIKLLEEKDIELMKEIIEDDNMVFDKNQIKNFISQPNTYSFIVKKGKTIIGFAYGHALPRPDGKKMFYLHDIGLLEKHRNKGTGSKFMKYIVEFVKEKEFSEIFLITDKGNPRACHVFEKSGLGNDISNEVCYVYEF